MKKLIYLIGPMGSGKSTVGRALAQRMGYEFVDADDFLVDRIGKSIPDIFAEEGESKFRDYEAECLGELAGKSNIVVATGGGVVLRPANRALMKNAGAVIYIYADIDILLSRTAGDTGRPLLQTEDRRGRLTQIFEERKPLYREAANICIDTTHLDTEAVVTTLLEQLQSQNN